MYRYNVLKKVGTGSYGSAYLVCSKADPQQQFVLKKIQGQDATEREKQQAQNEVKVLAKLHHPFVLGYVDDFTYKQQLCIITDFCEHGDLYQHLQDRKRQGKPPVQERQVLEWFVQMLLGLQHVHSNDVLHRDLKTQNIFLTKEGYVKLGDFGISRSLKSSSGMAITCIGTPYYMSPEVLQNLPYDYKSDMWSAGCILFELLSGRQAFDAPDMPGLMAKILAGAHQTLPQHISFELQVLMKQLLHSDPCQRPSCEAVLALPVLQAALAAANKLLATLQQQNTLPVAVASDAAAVVGRSASSRQLAAGRADVHPPPATAAISSRRSSRSRVLSPVNSSASLAPGTPAVADASLDEQLRAAEERLRCIQAQREAVREQVLMYQLGAADQILTGSAVPAQQLAAPDTAEFPSSSSRANRNRSSYSQLPYLPGFVPMSPSDSLQQQQQQQGFHSFSGTSSNNRLAFVAAAQARRTASQSQLDISCCTSSAAALAAAAAAVGSAGESKISVTSLPGVPISPRASDWHPAAAATIGSQRNGRDNLGHTVHLPSTGVAASVAAIEQLLLNNRLSLAASSVTVTAQGSAAVGTECSSSAIVHAGAAAATGVAVSRQHSEAALHLPSLPGSRRHSRRSIIDYSEPSDKLPAGGAASVLESMLVTQCDTSPPGSLSGRAIMTGLRGLSTKSCDSSTSLVGCETYSSSSYCGSGSGGNSSNGSTSSGSGSCGAAHVELIRAKHEASRAEELKRRAAELEQARRSYQLERAAAEVRASSLFDGATACIVPGITLGSSSSSSGASRPVLKHSGALHGQLQASPTNAANGVSAALIGSGVSSQMLQHSPAAKPPIAGRRSSKQLDIQSDSLSPPASIAAVVSGGALASSGACAAAGDGSCSACKTCLQSTSCIVLAGSNSSTMGLLADTELGKLAQQHQSQHELSEHDPVSFGVSGGHTAGSRHDCDVDFDEAEIDRQLAALAALRKANRRPAMTPAVHGSISAKSIVAVATALSPRDPAAAGQL